MLYLAEKTYKQAGFTLIEVMMTMLIIFIVMLGAGSFSAWTLSHDALARERTYATHIGEELIEEWAATNSLNNYNFTAAPAAGNTLTKVWTFPGLGAPLTLVASANTMTAPAPDGTPGSVLVGSPEPLEKIIRVQWNHKGIVREVIFIHATIATTP